MLRLNRFGICAAHVLCGFRAQWLVLQLINLSGKRKLTAAKRENLTLVEVLKSERATNGFSVAIYFNEEFKYFIL